MPRKQNTSGEHYNDPFPTMLRALMLDRNVIQDDLKDALGVKNRQSVTGYIDGSTAPTAEKIVAVANFFDISTDYLLGKSDVPSVTPELSAAAKYTGLSEKSVAILNDISLKEPPLVSALSFLLEDVAFYRLVLSDVRYFLHYLQRSPDYGDADEFIESATDEEIEAIDNLEKKYGAVVVGPSQVAKTYSANASDELQQIMNEHLYGLLYPPSEAMQNHKRFMDETWLRNLGKAWTDNEEGQHENT